MSEFTQNDSGIYIPNEKHKVRRKQKVETDESFLNSEALKTSGNRARTFVTVILILAAITTFSTGAIGVWSKVDWAGLTDAKWAQYVAQGAGVGLVLLILLDGSRLGWGFARTGNESTQWMQVIAFAMEGINFLMSAFVSVIGLAPLLIYLGLPLDFDPEWIQSMLTIVLEASFLSNICMAFLWLSLSPKSQRMTTMALIETERQDMYLTKIKKMLKDARSGESSMIDEHMATLIADDELRNFKRFLGMSGYEIHELGSGEPDAEGKGELPAPPIIVPAGPKREPVYMNGNGHGPSHD